MLERRGIILNHMTNPSTSQAKTLRYLTGHNSGHGGIGSENECCEFLTYARGIIPWHLMMGSALYSIRRESNDSSRESNNLDQYS